MNYGLIRNCRWSQTLPSAVRSESNLHGATFVSCFFLLPLSYIASSVIDMLPEPSYYIRGNIYSREIQILVSYTENSQAVSRCGSIIRAKNFFFLENSLATFIFLRDCWLKSEIMQIIIANIRWILYHCHPNSIQTITKCFILLYFYCRNDPNCNYWNAGNSCHGPK